MKTKTRRNSLAGRRIEPDFPYTISEAAEIIGVTTDTLKGYMSEGKIGCSRVGYKVVRILGQDILNFFKNPAIREEANYVKKGR